jgi:hypothetical protein
MKNIEKSILKNGTLKLPKYTLWYEYTTKLFMYSDNEYNHASATSLKELKEVIKEAYNINILN